MDKNNFLAKFTFLAAFVAVMPVLAWGVVIKKSSIASNQVHFVLLIAAFVLSFAGLLAMVYLFRRTQAMLSVYREQLRRRTAEIDILKDISDLTHDSPSMDDLLIITMHKVMETVRVGIGSVFLVDPSQPEGLRFVAAKPEMDSNQTDKKQHRYFFVKTVIQTGRPLVVSDIEQDHRTRKSNDPRYGSPSFISFPIYRNKKVLGVLNLANKENGGIFTKGDERLLSIVLGEVAFALENAGLRKALKEQTDQFKAVNAPRKS